MTDQRMPLSTKEDAMIDLETMPEGYRTVCPRCRAELRGATLRALSEGFGWHEAECTFSEPDTQARILKLLAEYPDDERKAKRLGMALLCKVGEAAANRLYLHARAELEAQRKDLERAAMLKSFGSDPQGAQAYVLAELAGAVDRIGEKLEAIASTPPTVNVQVPEQAAPVVQNRIEVPKGPAPIVNVQLPRKDRKIEFETDRNGKITGAKVKNA